MSPFFQYVSEVFSFPIRLQLTAIAGKLFSAAGTDIHAEGNMLLVNGNEFSVDPACMGLNMLVTSLLLCVMLIGIHQKKYHKHLSFVAVSTLLLVVFVLNIASNLFRILLLVQFAVLPGKIMHDIVGMLCLVLYVFAPAILLTRFAVKRFGVTVRKATVGSTPGLWPHLLLLAGLLIVLPKTLRSDNKQVSWNTSAFTTAGYKVHVVSDVIQLDNGKSLVYIKPIPNFYNADHNPMICWKGSGYTLRHINESVVSGRQVYTATLEKDNVKLFTCWWYDNGQYHTINQMDWRWQMIKGSKRFALVNVTSATMETLQQQVATIVTGKLLHHSPH